MNPTSHDLIAVIGRAAGANIETLAELCRDSRRQHYAITHEDDNGMDVHISIKLPSPALEALLYLPASDPGYNREVEGADIKTLERAMRYDRLTKTAREKIESRLRKLKRNTSE